ncbi:hypothetical protein KY290_001052 [Solanum tuberosum]|uniref:Uncharacterized protein n=1 Tax=Solanum tuberosum TaxID=4113 RepID=A0ABQ7WN30_SOLTU|nr:hypothetical protein KY290_001052 [Solanum tuberosum]
MQFLAGKGKKFAKPELESCIEEFEEKLNKFYIERKEQELTAKNAQSHQQKVESSESITVTVKEEEEIGESDITKDTDKKAVKSFGQESWRYVKRIITLLNISFCLHSSISFNHLLLSSSIKKISNGAAAQESEGIQDQNDEIEDVQDGPFPVEGLYI